MQIHTLQPSKGSKRSKKRIGRGNASGKGTYSTRGIKGQRARSGGKSGLKLRGLRRTIKRIPKKRGFKSFLPNTPTITLRTINHYFDDGDVINLTQLRSKRLIGAMDKKVKIVAYGKLKKKVNIKDCAVSNGARKQIEAKGGSIISN